MGLCRNCGASNPDDRDFCAGCGEYLRWEPTGYQAAVPEPPPAAPPPPAPGPPPAPSAGPYAGQVAASPAAIPAAAAAAQQPQARPESVLVALRLPSDDGYAGGAAAPVVEPGGRTTMIALVRNQSGIVDNYDMSVVGLPEGWWTITPGTVYLVPYGAGGGSYEQEIEVALHPPRSAAAEARPWEIRVVARSRAYGAEVGGAGATLTITPFQELESDLSPEVRGGRVRADFTLGVVNRSNAPVEVTFSGVDPENACHFSFHQMPLPQRAQPGLESAAGAVRQAQYLGLDHGADPRLMAQRMVAQFSQGNLGPLQKLLRGRNLPPPIGGLRLDPGERGEAVVSVSPPKQTWIGRTASRPFQVTVQPAGTDQPGPPVAGTFRHKPWLPWWLLIVVPLLCALVVLVLSQRAESTRVPDLSTAQDLLAAEGLLKDAKLVLGEKVEEVDDEAKAGSIIGQEPEPGAEVETGTAVAVKIAVSSGKAPVPDVTGKTLAEAGSILTQAGFQLGPNLTEPADPTADTVTSQVPVAGTPAPAGSAVQLVFGQPGGAQTGTGTTPADTSGQAGGGAGAGGAGGRGPAGGGGGGGAGGAGGAAAAVPAVTGLAQAKGADALAKNGLVPVVSSVFDEEVPAGQIVSQDPPPGGSAPDGQVKIVVSLGFPDIILELNGNIVRIGGATGRPVAKLAATPDIEEEPSISPNGRLVAYKRRAKGSDPESGQIWILDPADPASARPLTTPGFNDGRPAISPDGRVVAFVSNRGGNPGDTDLCLVRLDQVGAQPGCVADGSTQVSRPAWSPDGRSIVVVGTDAAQSADRQTELLLYTSQTPSSSSPADWVRQGFVTDAMHGSRPGEQVVAAAFAPDGSQLAFTANWGDGVSKVMIAQVKGGVVASEKPTVQAKISGCELSWRSDGRELAVAVRDAGCDQKGRIVRVALARPDRQTVLTRVGASSGSPVWSPVASG